MPSKARRNKKMIQARRGSSSTSAVVNMAATNIQPVKNISISRAGGKAPVSSISSSQTGTELKRIALVTLLIAVIMAVAYFVFR